MQALSTDIKAAVAVPHKDVSIAMVQLGVQANLLARINGQRPLSAMHGLPIRRLKPHLRCRLAKA